MNKEEFDRSVCFTFFNDYHEQIMRVREAYGPVKAFDVYEAIANYGLYETKISDPEIILLVGASLLKNIDNSQKKRAQCFAGEDIEMTRKIIKLHLEHPEYSQNKIVQILGTSKGKVNRTLQKYKNSEYNDILEECNTSSNANASSNSTAYANPNAYTNPYTTVTVTEPMTEYYDLEEEIDFGDVPTETICDIYTLFQQGSKYDYISKMTGLPGKKIHAIIEDGKKWYFASPDERPFN